MDFNLIKQAVATQFEHMQKSMLFRVNIDKDELWRTYLNSFPGGSNPIWKVRTEHDCSCCRQFIRNVGDIVAIINNKIISIWDITVKEPAYQVVVNELAKFVKSKPILDPFFHYEKTVGTDKNFQQLLDSSEVITFTHFFVNINPRFVLKKDTIPTKLNELRSAKDVFSRSLNEITDESIEVVLDLINQNSLYRGEEHKGLVTSFKEAKSKYQSLPELEKTLFTWTNSIGALARIRTAVIGTLLVELSEGKDIDDAVRAYESKVAPTNYKRPTALITKKMIEKAKATITELGLTSALERRYATLNDITINNLIFANRNTRKVLGENILDSLVPTAGIKTKDFDKVEVVPIEKFISDIVPRAESIEVMFENRLNNNLVSLVAPADATSLNLFKWPNKFSWSYKDNVADSIKEKVKKAGGNINADLCCRLAWYNYDDLDLHLITPDKGHIFYGYRQHGGGALDVDMNAGGGRTREPVENIFYQNKNSIPKGEYTLYVNQFSRRETIDVGFEVEIDYCGEIYNFVYDKAVVNHVIVAKFRHDNKGFHIIESLPQSQATKTFWNLPTQSFHQVSALMFSPNHWDGNGIGNKHYFFMLENCKNADSARGFFNEFLKPELDVHRKVLEVVGSKMKTNTESEQLSGLGFSSTQRNTLVCRVKGSFSRTIKVQF